MRQVLVLIHAHTRASDGTRDAGAIARLAARAGVEVVALTDHDVLSPGAGYWDGVLVLAGQEISPRHNHVLALGQDETLPLPERDGLAGELARGLDSARRAGAWAALAHPLDPPITGLSSSKAYVAEDFSRLDDCPGLELWNCLSAFKTDLSSPLAALARLCMPKTFLPGPHPLLLALWDSQGRRRAWPALGGADAHGFGTGRWWLPLKVFSYRRHLDLILTGLWLKGELSGDWRQDLALVKEALAAGRAFLCLGRAKGFDCRLRGPSGEEHWPGLELPWRSGFSLEATLPAWGRARLLRNGRLVASGLGRRFAWNLEGPGVWRVEASRLRPPAGWRPWIYCNPFYLRGEA